MPKFAPAREDGLKPWHVTISEWGKQRTHIEWAEDARSAEYQAVGRMRYVSAKARRATPADLADGEARDGE